MTSQPPAYRESQTFFLVLFFFSGFAALLYQVVWQRALFGVFGIDAESVTIVVTTFMLGLGFGSLVGGALSHLSSRHLLIAFATAELLIGAFGWFSLELFRWAGALTIDEPRWTTASMIFALLLLPTLLMGASLPLLFGYRVRIDKHVGRSVGTLYFVNTLGSAIAAFAAVFGIMKYFGLGGSVIVAAMINIGVSGLALARARRDGGTL